LNQIIRWVSIPVCTLLLGISLVVAAEANSPLKVGVIDWQPLLTKSPQSEEASSRLENEFKEPKASLIKKQKEFQAKQEKLQRDKDTMSDVERGKGEKELAKMGQDYRRMEEEFRSNLQERQKVEMDDFMKAVREVVDKIAVEEKYDLVIPQDGLLYIADRIDITDKVLEGLAKAKPTKSETKTKK